MSAFAVIYERSNTPVEPGVLERVMSRLSQRGPDGSDMRQAGSVALGHWHFWTTPEEAGERQPLQLAGQPYIIVMDGRLDNRPDLFAELRIPLDVGRGLSDTALVLHAYDRWGEKCFERFVGEFALAIYDQQKRELVCARDPLGDRTLFYSQHGTRLVIASEPWAVAGAETSPVELDEVAVAYYFALRAPQDGRSLFKGITELLPAHGMVVNDNGVRLWRYWQPDFSKKLRGKTDAEYAEQFLALLDESVRCRMRATTPVGILMSGGLDSGSVACLAARQIAPEKLTTISYVFDELPECDERQYIQTIVDRWGVNSIQIPCDDAWPLKDWQNWPRNPNQPEGSPYRLLKERAYHRAHEEGLRVLFTGVYGDELYSTGVDWLADLLLEGRIREAIRELIPYLRYAGLHWTLEAGYLQRAGRRILDVIPGAHRLHRQRQAPDWLAPYSVGLLSNHHARRNAELEQYDHLVGLWAARDVSREMVNADRHAIELRNPYRDRRLVEYVLTLPAYQLYYRGYYKHILRNAMKGALPEMVRTRRGPTSLSPLYIRGLNREAALFKHSIQEGQACSFRFIDFAWLKRKWDALIRVEKDGAECLIPWLCIAYHSWIHSVIH